MAPPTVHPTPNPQASPATGVPALETRAGEIANALLPAHGRETEGTDHFEGHYEGWRQRRLTRIVEHYGAAFFPGRRVLEVGCGHADLGAALAALGARVTVSDARWEHLGIVRQRHPDLITQPADLDHEWPFEGHFDLVLHLGTLYHLEHFEENLRRTCRSTNHLVLESEVCDSDDPHVAARVREDAEGYDQAANGVGSRPSAAYLERVLAEEGFRFTRVDSAHLNSDFHCYDWPVTNSGQWRDGLRRFWFAQNNPTQR